MADEPKSKTLAVLFKEAQDLAVQIDKLTEHITTLETVPFPAILFNQTTNFSVYNLPKTGPVQETWRTFTMAVLAHLENKMDDVMKQVEKARSKTVE